MSRLSAIVLGAGAGKRMGSETPKQYLPLCGKPLIVYALEAFAQSRVDEIVFVVAPGEISYCRDEIVEKYHIQKVNTIVEGGAERYDSVYAGLQAVSGEYVFIHDGARAFVSQEVIARCIQNVMETDACVAGVPVKDTIKRCDASGVVEETLNRSCLWTIQTPQCFRTSLIKEAYDRLYQDLPAGITDDAMVLEQMMGHSVQMVMGDYDNIKVTTPEDLLLGEMILRK